MLAEHRASCWIKKTRHTCWTADLSDVLVGSVNACQRTGAAPLSAALGGIGGACRCSRLGKRPSTDWIHSSGVEVVGDEISEVGGVDAGSCCCYEQNGSLSKHDYYRGLRYVSFFRSQLTNSDAQGKTKAIRGDLKLCIKKASKVHILNGVLLYTYYDGSEPHISSCQ